MNIEISVFGGSLQDSTAQIEDIAADAGTINLAMLDPEQGEGAAGMVGFFSIPAAAWPALRDQIDALVSP